MATTYNGYKKLRYAEGVYTLTKKDKSGKISVIEAEAKQMKNGDVEFMTKHGLTLSPERKRKVIAAFRRKANK